MKTLALSILGILAIHGLTWAETPEEEHKKKLLAVEQEYQQELRKYDAELHRLYNDPSAKFAPSPKKPERKIIAPLLYKPVVRSVPFIPVPPTPQPPPAVIIPKVVATQPAHQYVLSDAAIEARAEARERQLAQAEHDADMQQMRQEAAYARQQQAYANQRQAAEYNRIRDEILMQEGEIRRMRDQQRMQESQQFFQSMRK